MDTNHERITSGGGIGAADADVDDTEAYSLLMSYPEETDYYALLGLPRDPPPSDGAIRSAYRTLTLSFHPDKQPSELQEAAGLQFERIRGAYETLVDPRKRVVYDLLGAEGVRREWGPGGAMGRGGDAERQQKQNQVGVKAMKPEEFRRWFFETMKRRERGALNSMVRSKGSLIVGVDAGNMISVDEESDDVYLNVPSAKLSDFAVRYSFVAPFPTLRSILGEGEKEDDESEEEKKDEKEDSQGNEHPELEIYAGVSGRFQRFFNEMELEFENGETELRKVPLPLVLSTQDINLGASTSRVFSDPNPKGILKRWPFSFLQNSLVSVDATVLPATTVQANIAKSFVLVPGTRPFNVVLGTTFSRSIFIAPPALSLQVTKGIGEKKIAFGSWTSGFISWPLVIQTLLLPFGGLDSDAFLIGGQELSQLQVGIASQASKLGSTEGGDGIPEPEEDEEEEEIETIRAKQRKERKAAEAWQVAIASSPVSNGIVFKYSRNIFSGKAATDVALSQWSSEKHYSLPPSNEPRSIRLEIASAVDVNLSPTWSVHGSRQVSELTQMGFGVGIRHQGLFMTVSWARLGQRIKFPIAVCPLDSVNANSVTLALLLPSLAYCAIEFGFIRPRERRNRRKVIARWQKRLRKLVPQKIVESAQATELMADQVLRRQVKEGTRGGLVITKAEYGHYPSSRWNAKTDIKEPKVAEVTIPVAALVDHGQLIIPKNMAKFHILGFYDPAPLQPKKLRIWYQYHGEEHYIEANDAEGVTCPMRSHLLAS